MKSPVARASASALEMDVLSLLARLAASVPPPRAHLVRHGGVLAPLAARGRG